MRGWSLWTVPSLVYVSNALFWTSLGIKIDVRGILLGYLLFNWYAFSISTLSGMKEKYLVVFVPWIFLPPITTLSIRFLGTVFPGFFATFALTLVAEWWKFGSLRTPVLFLRISVAILVAWELGMWLRDFTVLSNVIAGK